MDIWVVSVLALVNNTALISTNQYLFEYLFFKSLEDIPKRGIVGSYGNSTF